MLANVCLVWLAMLFAYAGALKLIDPRGVRHVLGRQGILPASFVRPASWGLIGVELCCALLLAGANTRSVGIALVATISVLLLPLSLVLMRRKVSVPCGCAGSVSRAAIGPATTARAALMLAASAVVWMAPPPVSTSPMVFALVLAIMPAALVRLRRWDHDREHRRSSLPLPELVAQIQSEVELPTGDLFPAARAAS
jgi:hypothetical protein